MKNREIQLSKILSLLLRHKPEEAGIELDENGWTGIRELVEKISEKYFMITFDLLEKVVLTNDKRRFSFNEDRTKIRANQGHSINVELNLKQMNPPEFLYHGTVDKFLISIKENGLQKQKRLHVHLSKDTETALKVGERRGNPIILKIMSGEMSKNGYNFYLSENGVWLTDHVPFKYINL